MMSQNGAFYELPDRLNSDNSRGLGFLGTFQGCSILPPVNAKLSGFPAPIIVISWVFKATVEMGRRGGIRAS